MLPINAEPTVTRFYVIFLDQFLLHMKFLVRLDEIYYAVQTFAGHFCLLHFRIIKKSKFIVIKHDRDVA